MSKNVQIELRLDLYRDFFDRDWFEKRTDETRGTSLYQPVFDLGAAWRYAANTHVLPWLLATMVQGATEMNVNTTEPFGKKYIADVRNVLVERMGDSIRNMQRKRIQRELEAIYEEAYAITVTARASAPDMMWQNMLQNSEFRFALVGSQRLCYGAIYYAYEDFLTRCVGLAKGITDFRLFRRADFQREITAEFGAAVCDQCWDNVDINLARVTRHALVHNGCRINREFNEALKAVKRPLEVSDDEIQIMAPDTSSLFHLLKDRASQLITAALQHPNIK